MELKLFLLILIAIIWFVNGLYCKILNFVPRHQQIVARILGARYAFLFTKLIGFSELLMVVWIVSGIAPVLCGITQIFIIMLMNCIEFVLAKDLLLFKKFNFLFASMLCFVIYYTYFC